MNTLWLIIFGAVLVTADYAVQKGGTPTFKELVTPSKEYKQDILVYDQIQKVDGYYIPVSDTVYFVTRKSRNRARSKEDRAISSKDTIQGIDNRRVTQPSWRVRQKYTK